MSQTIITPTTSSDPSSGWNNDANAVGWPYDGSVADTVGAGLLALKTMSGRLTIPLTDEIIGFEAEIVGWSLAPAKSFVTAAYDLQVPTVITRVRRRYGTANGNAYSYYVEASHDGLIWVNPYSGPAFPADLGGMGFLWTNEQDMATGITATPYRYWRTVVLDMAGDSQPDCRIGDFRLYTSAGIITSGGIPMIPGPFDAIPVVLPTDVIRWNPSSSRPLNWPELQITALVNDNSPGDNTTYVRDQGFLDVEAANVYLSIDGVNPVGSPKKLILPAAPTISIATVVLGSPTDDWGYGSWEAIDVRGASFALLLERSTALEHPAIDAARVSVYHTIGGGSMALRETVRQQILIGRETPSLGSSVTANVRLRHARIQPQPSPEFREHRPAGEKLANHQLVLREQSQGPIDGIPTYDELGYLLQSVVARPNTSILSAGVAFRHVFHLDNRARDNVASYNCEYGDLWSRAHKVVAMLVNSLDLNFRQDGMDLGGSIISRQIQDGISMSVGAATVQTITQSGTGVFRLRFRGQETADITASGALTNATLQTALRALPYVGGSTELVVAGGAGGPFTVTFGNLASEPFKGIKQPLLESRVISGTPTVSIAMTTGGGYVEYPGVPIMPRHIEFFMTPTLASIASSKLSGAHVTNFSMANKVSPVFDLDRANTSWRDFAETPNLDVKFSLMIEAGSTGMSFLPQGRDDTILYLRLLATGGLIGASAFPHRLQIDCPVKVSNFGPFGDSQETYAFEYELSAAFENAINSSLVLTLDNGVANYD